MLSNIIRHAAAVCVAFILGFFGMSAFDLSTYADHSVLSQGNWTKIRVETTGLYRLSKSTLAQMGLSAENVHIYGYGGNRIDDRLTVSNYIDDLPEVKGTLYAAPILSTVAHGRLESVDTQAALQLAGVHGVVLAQDIPGDPVLAAFAHDGYRVQA